MAESSTLFMLEFYVSTCGCILYYFCFSGISHLYASCIRVSRSPYKIHACSRLDFPARMAESSACSCTSCLVTFFATHSLAFCAYCLLYTVYCCTPCVLIALHLYVSCAHWMIRSHDCFYCSNGCVCIVGGRISP